MADIQSSATVDWSPLGDIYVKYVENNDFCAFILLLYRGHPQHTQLVFS